LLINRHLDAPADIRIERRLVPKEAVWLSADDINANNETTEIVSLRSEALSGTAQDQIDLQLPPHSAVVLKADKESVQPDGGADASPDAGDFGTDEINDGDFEEPSTWPDGGDAKPDEMIFEDRPAADQPGRISGSCGCGRDAAASGMSWLALFLIVVFLRRR